MSASYSLERRGSIDDLARAGLTLEQAVGKRFLFNGGVDESAMGEPGLMESALRHLGRADVPPGMNGVPEDWNELVISTRAFLLEDRAALLASKQRVAAMKKPAFPGSADIYLKYLGQRFGAWDEETAR